MSINLPSLKSFRALPPAGGFIDCCQIFKAAFNLKWKKDLTSFFPDHAIFLVNSGKSALYLYFLATFKESQSKEIALSGYTCPDVAVAAIKAGYKIRLLDVEFDSPKLKIKPDRIEGIETIVLSNLYGQVDEVGEDACAVMIDDACQAALSFRRGVQVGVAKNKVGVFSFGRGKAFSGSGGGLLLLPKRMTETNSAAVEIYSRWREESFITSVFKLLKCCMYSLLENPYLYRVVLLIPFLKIGETKVEFNFTNLRGGNGTKILFLAAQQSKLGKSEIAKKLRSIFEDKAKLKNDEDLVAKNSDENLIRFPLIVSEKVKDKICSSSEVGKKALQLGITGSYPLTIRDYFDPECFSSASEEIPNSIRISKTLVTLPIGPNVSKKDAEEIIEFLLAIENDKIE